MSVEAIAPGLWCVNSHFPSMGFKGSVRMSVARGDDGALALYSPVAMTEADVAAIEALGPVAAIVAPNTFHYRWLRAAAELFPAARVFVPEGLEAKIGAVPRAETMTRATPPALPPGIAHFIFDRHAIRETALFHGESRTLVTSDLLYNYQREHGAGEKAMFGLLGCYGSPKVVFYHRFALQDKAQVAELIAQVEAWRPRRIVMCHGRIVESEDAPEIFARAWRPFLGAPTRG
ncbi:MAG: hypothetical protein B7Z33_09635 [Sphingomonadales bacterium 12-68-11]|nr:MAG: hypothetical protein B7Z33_09635 [Sphingomonadales bacterium 12-68-11]OYX16793.1 MAG: hypothetical protein B7Z07_01955 [Sphingomonadales bacterium 32-67-7]